ncbi:hypothetical protein ACQPZX_41390 [Actinoplanes sp. CA-142083]|uniref:hypothetical protein n=1 Tax=Actinoplanes sp. CA-142083 TaxID=3239903 RepID=UPI003D936FC7
MAFPAGLTLVSVHIKVDLPPDGGAAGSVLVAAPYPLIGGADNSIVPSFERTVALDDATGEATVALPACNDPQWTPVGWPYRVEVYVGGQVVPGTMQLDYQTTEVEFADVFQVDGAATPGVSYIPLSQRGVAGGVAGLDVDGDVIDASGAKITGGEGGGAAPGTTVVSETSYGQSATAGTGTSYSRSTHSHGTPALPSAADVGADAAGTAVAAVAAHAADTTAVHGIADTSALVLTDDDRLTDARTPTAHASSHADGGSDELALDGSQITTGTVAVGRIPTGTSGTTVAAGNDSRITGAAQKASNLSDLANAGTARTNLGLGGAATLSVGTSAGTVAAGDDSRITGAQQRSTLTTKGDLYVATASATIARLGVGSDDQVLTADSSAPGGVAWADPPGGGGGSTIVTKRGYVTSGDITVQNTSNAWQLLTGGPTFSIAAAVGDEIIFNWAGLRQHASNLFWDTCVIVSGAAVRYSATGTSTPAIEGDPSMYPPTDTSFPGHSSGMGFSFIAESGDIAGGNVTFGFALRSDATTGKLFAGTNYPLRWHITNNGPQS